MTRIDGHACWINSKALSLLPKLPDKNPEGGIIVRDSNNEPTGIFTDNAMDLLVTPYLPKPSKK